MYLFQYNASGLWILLRVDQTHAVGVSNSVMLRECTLVWYGGDRADGLPKLGVGCIWFLTRSTQKLRDDQCPNTETFTTTPNAQVTSAAEEFQTTVTAALCESCVILVVLLLSGLTRVTRRWCVCWWLISDRGEGITQHSHRFIRFDSRLGALGPLRGLKRDVEETNEEGNTRVDCWNTPSW